MRSVRRALGLVVLVCGLAPLGGCATDYCGEPDVSPQPELTEATVLAIAAPIVTFELADQTALEVEVRGDLDPLVIGETYLVPFYGFADASPDPDETTTTTTSTAPPLFPVEQAPTTTTVEEATTIEDGTDDGGDDGDDGEVALRDVTAYMPSHDCSGGAIRHLDESPLDIGSAPFSGFEKLALTAGLLGGTAIIVWATVRRARGEFL